MEGVLRFFLQQVVVRQGSSADDQELMLSTDVEWRFPQPEPEGPVLIFS
jgi:hypothetical protein